MEFKFPAETEQWRSELRAFLKQEIPPGFEGDDDFFDNEDQMAFARQFTKKLGSRGWFAPAWPREYGGGGLSRAQLGVLEREMARLKCRQPQFSLGIWMLGPVLLELGTEEQKREHLIPMMRGQWFWCQGFSEPNAGSDLASLKTSARLEGD